MKSKFSCYHPVTQFVYFFSVTAVTVFVRQPVFLLISLCVSLLYSYRVCGRKAFRSAFFYMLPVFLLITAINPLFNHAGVTVLAYLPDGNPLTAESVVYGAVSAFMLSAVVMWCLSLQIIMTSDRVIYLFGRAAPRLGLLISMILRFIPRFSLRFKQVRNARRCIGRDITDGNALRRISNAAVIFSSMIRWSAESSIETADSMKSRGYGLPHRTSFSLFRFEKRDFFVLLFILICDSLMIFGGAVGFLSFDYFPYISNVEFGGPYIFFYVIYFLVCTVPFAVDSVR